ncbi:MAG TPA: Sau3AI family type II restriction endonuclease [Candidatus Paceibacterota bacterium]
MNQNSDQISDEEPTLWQNKQEVLSFGKKLIGKNLRTQSGIRPIPAEALDSKIGARQKASMGTLLERYYYNIKPGNESRPDFQEIGVELKTTPIKKLAKGLYSAKERLVLNLINYRTESETSFTESSFYKKNASIMLFSYLHEKEVAIGDLEIKIVDLLEYQNLPEADRKIILSDWHKINAKIRANDAHNLSEGDTLYLGACTKSANSSVRTMQGNGIEAKPRAYAFKSGYMTALTRRLLGKQDPDAEAIIKSDEQAELVSDFENMVTAKFAPYIGKDAHRLLEGFGIGYKSKSKFAILARRILGVSKNKVEEFEKAEVSIKTIRVDSKGKPLESISFPTFKFSEFIEENWDDDNNTFRKQIEKRFFFVIFEERNDSFGNPLTVLKKVLFWTMPLSEIETTVREMWQQAQNAVAEGNLAALPRQGQRRIIHVRPHGKTGKDFDFLPNGTPATKRCFWLNALYVKDIIR